MNETEVEKLTNRIDGLEKKASVKDRLNELRFWHLRWRCLQCEEGKTDFKGEWECALCGYEQNNVY